MPQSSIVSAIVNDFKSEPRNKIRIDCDDVCFYVSSFFMELNPELLASALVAYNEGRASEEDESIVDFATSLCHDVADRCWGECENDQSDEWTEVDISTEWSDVDAENKSDLFVTIRQCWEWANPTLKL